MSITLDLEERGALKFELFVEEAPETCKNFLALAASDYYYGTKFHRNIKGFILQGGDPSGTGKGGESIYGKDKLKDEICETLKHDKRGLLVMANSNKPQTSNS